MGAFGTVAGNLGNDILAEKVRRESAGLEQQQLGLEHQKLDQEQSRLDRESQQQDIANKRADADLDLRTKEYQLRQATSHIAGYEFKDYVKNSETGEWMEHRVKPGSPDQYIPVPNHLVPESIVRSQLTEDRKNPDLKEFMGPDGKRYSFEYDPPGQGSKYGTGPKIMRAGPIGTPGYNWARVAEAPEPASTDTGGLDLDAISQDVAEGRANLPGGKLGVAVANRMKQLGLKPLVRDADAIKRQLDGDYNRYRSHVLSVAKAKVDPGLLAALYQAMGVRNMDELNAAIDQERQDLLAKYKAAGLQPPISFSQPTNHSDLGDKQ